MTVVKLPVLPVSEHDPVGLDARRCAEGEGVVDDMQPLIPPGTYLMRYVEHQTIRMFSGRQAKVVVRLEVCTNGFVGTKLERWYNVKELIGKPARFGRFRPGRSSDLVREFAGIFDLPPRFDRIPLTKLKGVLLAGDVDTVTMDRNQRALPKSVCYSVVRRIARADT